MIGSPRGMDRAALTRGILAGAGWLVVTALGLIALGRLGHLDDALVWPYTGVNAFTPVIYLPAYAAVAVGFGLRRNFLLVAAVAVVIVHLVWTVPEVMPGGPEKAPEGTVGIRLLTSNLHFGNDRADQLDGLVRAQSPDLVVLQEVSPLNLLDLEASSALTAAAYPHREVHPAASGATGWAVYSKYPLTDVTAREAGGQPLPRMTVQVDDRRRFVLFDVHTPAPTNSAEADRWRAQLESLLDDVERADLPVVLAGDFNATRDHRPFRRLTGAGLRDAHDVVDAGWSPTWRADGLLPALLRIDHVLASRAFDVTRYHTGDDVGSDHVPLTVDLALM